MITPTLNPCISDTISLIQSMDKTIERISHLITVSNDTISNEIAAVNTLLVVFSFALALVGIGLGIYISVLRHKVIRIKESIEEKERTVLKLTNTVAETDKKITTNLSDLYKQMQYEESISLLKRLEDEPLDISNLCPQLLTRSLNENGFLILKNAYLKFLEIDPKPSFFKEKRSNYRILLFQHFSYLSLLDENLRDDLIDGFPLCTKAAFKSDIIKTTKDLCNALSIDSAPFNKVDVLSAYLKAINSSKYKDLVEIKNTLEDNIRESILAEAIDNCTNDKCYLSMFGVSEPNDSNEEDNNDYNEDD